MDTEYSRVLMLIRRILTLLIGICAFPLVTLLGKRAPFYSLLHRIWIRRSQKPAWMIHAEPAQQQLI